MTIAVISDPRLQELYHALGETGHGTDIDAMERADEAFILALNERLAAAEKMAWAAKLAVDVSLTYLATGKFPPLELIRAGSECEAALAAYRATQPEQKGDSHK